MTMDRRIIKIFLSTYIQKFYTTNSSSLDLLGFLIKILKIIIT